ncbi:TonB-dependent receptor [soil metagenome]
MRSFRAPRVRGSMTVGQALQRLLQGSGYRAVRIGALLYRIEKAPVDATRRIMPSPPPTALPDLPQRDIVVTAQKRSQSLSALPLSVSIIALHDLPSGTQSPTSRDISLSTEGLAMTNLGPGRNRQFIRGVADSPFTGQSQSTVAVQIDDARVTFDAPDPDLRLIDMERVEILKGPQGPLYGSGALGGIYHIVTRMPELDAPGGAVRLSGQAVDHGGIGSGAEAIANIPILDDRLALRAVAYSFRDTGWIDDADGRKDSNSVRTTGARLALRWSPAVDWTADAGFAFQDIDVRDSQYVLTSRKTLSRTNAFAEPSENLFKLAHLRVQADLGRITLLSATSYTDHNFNFTLDATPAAGQFGIAGTARFVERRAYTLFNQEMRLTPTRSDRWLAGLSYLRATTRSISTIAGTAMVPEIVQSLDRITSEYAMFGEGKIRLFSAVDATIGARLFQSIAEDETSEAIGRKSQHVAKTIVSPSIALSRPLGDKGVAYLRYARAMRPGGLTTSNEVNSGRYSSDELDNIDLGFRTSSADDRLGLSASTYFTRWSDIQSDYLLPNGIVATRNAGRGSIIGIEGAIDWQLGRGLRMSAGGTMQSARLTHAADGLKLEDTRLPVTPDMSGRLSIAQHVVLADWQGQAVLQANYIGKARLSFDSDLDRQMGNYATVAVYGEISRASWTVGLRIDNILDVKGDSFAFGNPFSIRTAPQFTPLRPRALTVSIGRHW